VACRWKLPEEEVRNCFCRARNGEAETKVGDGEARVLDLLQGDGTLPEKNVDNECLRG